MKRVAIYARYSTELQNPRSIEDQILVCKERAEREGWNVCKCYTDYAISGASMFRPGLQQLLQDGFAKKLDIIVAEALDRISRDQADMATIFKRMQFAGIEIITLSEGRVSIVDVGLRGTMNQLYRVENANKIRRGQHGRIKEGKAAGGIPYGYDAVRKFDANGNPIRGERQLNRAEAKVVRRIFRDYAAGVSVKAITFALNKEGIPSRSGRYWNQSTIDGGWRRGVGILNNQHYIGRLVWNRRTYTMDPDTGKRLCRFNPKGEWITGEIPQTRIVGQDLWDRVKARQQKRELKAAEISYTSKKVHWIARPTSLLSGLLRCGCCGNGYTIRRNGRYSCNSAANKGTCSNHLRIGKVELEKAVLDALKERLTGNPELGAHLCAEFARRLKDARTQRVALIQDCREELSRLKVERDRIAKAIKDRTASRRVKADLARVVTRHQNIERSLARALTCVEPNPTLAKQYRDQVSGFIDALGSNHRDHDSYDSFRSLMGKIVLKPNADGTALLVDVCRETSANLRRRKLIHLPR